jgi:hypothetical protein
MDPEIEVLDETCNSLEIIENALLVCQILPIPLIGIFSITITQVMPWFPLPLAIVFSIIISWLVYCTIAVKFLIKAMIYAESRNVVFDLAVKNKMLIKEGFFSHVFYTSRKDKDEISELLSNPAYKRNAIEFEVRTSLTYLLFLLFSSITIGVNMYGMDLASKAQKIKFWTILALVSFGLIYSLKGLFNRQLIFTLLPQGIKLPDEDIFTFDKIRNFKIVRKGSGRYSTKCITFQHLASSMGNDIYIHKELDFQHCNISVRKLNYYYDLNMKNYKLQ